MTPATSLATSAHLEPATRQVISPPTLLAAVMAFRVTGESLVLSCSARTRVEACLERLVRGRMRAGLRLSIFNTIDVSEIWRDEIRCDGNSDMEDGNDNIS